MIVAPTEPAKLRAAGDSVSMFPETFGVDVIWRSRGRWIGVQRKELKDLVASVNDGRLGVQLSQMQRLDLAVVVVEGEPKWTLEGEMIGGGYGRGLTESQYRGVLWSVQNKGVWVDRTRDLNGTIAWIQSFQRWAAKDRHVGLVKRDGPVNPWGVVNNEDYARHLVMGLPGIGVELAGRIVEKFGVPFRWGVTREELLEVEGLGAKKVEMMMRALGVDGADDE